MMRKGIAFTVFAAILLAACRSEIKEDRVKLEASRSLEIALDYIRQQRTLHEFDLNRKMRLVNDKIKRTPADNKTRLDSLNIQKKDLEKKLRVLQLNTDASTKRITEKWGRYNQSLDAMLKNMRDYLKGIPIDKDTLPKKDTLPE